MKYSWKSSQNIHFGIFWEFLNIFKNIICVEDTKVLWWFLINLVFFTIKLNLFTILIVARDECICNIKMGY
jgi:hypothetical protein